MVSPKILKEKINTINSVVKLTKTIVGIIVALNIGGFFFKRVEFTFLLSLILLIFLWLWALDSQVGKIEEHLNIKNKGKKKGEEK